MEQIKLFFTLSFFSIITAGYYNNYYNPPIIVSAVCGDLSQVKSYCTASTINAKGNNGQTALMHSCISNSGDIFVFLMENNADFNIKDSFGKTALDYAIENNRVEMIEYLAISSGLDVDQILKAAQDAQEIINKKIKTQEFITEIKKSYPDLDKIRSCIAGGVDVNAVDVNDKNHPGWTALIYASINNRTEIVKLLLGAGADVNAKCYYGWTALRYVRIDGHTETVKLLLYAGADFNANLDLFINALSKAAINGDTEMVKLLIATGADVNAGDGNGETALIKAAENGHIEIVKLLISAGADLNSKDGYGDTVLLHSTRSYYNITQRENYRELSKLFIESGADVNAKNCGWTALIGATYYGEIEIVKLLLAAGVDVNAKGNDGKTALMLAKNYNYPEIVKLLEQHAKNKTKANLTKKAKIISAKKALNRKNNRGTN